MGKFASLSAGMLETKGWASPGRVSRPDNVSEFARRTIAEVCADNNAADAGPVYQKPPSLQVMPHGLREAGSNVVEQREEDPVKTFHVNVRLKRLRFVKLKVSAALLRRSSQDIVVEALDRWFEKLPADVLGDCVCMRGTSD